MLHNEHDRADKLSYQTWLTVQRETQNPIEDFADYWKWILSCYPYFRSRLLAPGRAYDSEEDGMLAIGGSAHASVMDLDVKLKGMSKQAQDTAMRWMDDSSPDDVAYWRKLGRGHSPASVYRHRSELVEKLNESKSPESVVDSMSASAS